MKTTILESVVKLIDGLVEIDEKKRNLAFAFRIEPTSDGEDMYIAGIRIGDEDDEENPPYAFAREIDIDEIENIEFINNERYKRLLKVCDFLEGCDSGEPQ